MIVIPDIHGRTFWKDAVSGRENEEIVFLGDYLDPYPDEPITNEQALENFKEIIEFKKQHPDNVVLLFGNHDAHYTLPGFYEYGRYCRWLSRDIGKLISANFDLFEIAFEKEINGKRYVFSHSYIHKLWLDDLYGKDEWDEKTVISRLNEDFKNVVYGLCCALSHMSAYRGGWESYGSMLWADIREVDLFKKPVVGDYAVFGHTQLVRPVVTEYKACLDCRRGFLINTNGEICELDGTKIKLDKPKEKQK